MNSLGVGRVSLEDKVACNIHQAWLEYGPSEDSLRALFIDARAVLTDMGVEFGIANAHDVLPEFFGRESTGERGFLFPLALQVPGTKHIIDLIVRSVLGHVKWFPAALTNIKAIVQWLHKVRKREAIQDLITRLATEQDIDPTELSSAFSRHPGAFADWRWTSLYEALTDILHVKASLTFLFEHLRSDDKPIVLTKEDGRGIQEMVRTMSVFDHG